MDNPSVHTQTSHIGIGVFTSGQEEQYHIALLQGVIDAAREHDVNLITYAGGALDSPLYENVYYNTVYELATPAKIDALVLCSGTLANFVGIERLVEFSERYPIPKVSLGIKLRNARNVVIDNTFGMRQVIQHLVEVHGYRRIAFICGPEGNEEATLRFQAYLDTLHKYHIPFDPQLVVPGNFVMEDGTAAIRILLDERKVAFQALVGANDTMAAAALMALQKRAMNIPDDIAVVGFDDIEDTESVIPALTTVRQPLHELGKRGVELALALLRGEAVMDLCLETELVVRRSCGCTPGAKPAVPVEISALSNVPVETVLSTLKGIDLAQLLNVQPGSRLLQFSQRLYDAFLCDLSALPVSEPVGKFETTVNLISREQSLQNVQVEGWQQFLSILHQHIFPILRCHVVLRNQVEPLLQQVQMLIAVAVQQAKAYRELQYKLQVRALNAVSRALLTLTKVSDLANIMPEWLPVLGIKACYIALYDDPAREWSRLVFAYDQYSQQISTSNTSEQPRFRSKDLIPQSLVPTDRRTTLLIEALYFKTEQFGFIVLEIELSPARIYKTLQEQISSALHTTFLMRQLKEKHNLLQTLIENLPDYVYAKDREGHLIISNNSPAATGENTSSDGEVNRDASHFFREDLAAHDDIADQRVIQSGQPLLNYERQAVDELGNRRWVLTTQVPLWDSADEIRGLVGISRDITERKHIEEAELEQRQLAEALYDTAVAINSTLNLDEVLDRILANLDRVVPYTAADIMFIESGTAYIVRARGYSALVPDARLKELRFDVNNVPMWRQMVETGALCLAADTIANPYWITFEETRWIRSFAGAPIRIKGSTIGFINLTAMTPGFFTQKHVDRLKAFADQAAVAIANARLYDALRQYTAELEQRVEQRTLELLRAKDHAEAILNNSSDAIIVTGSDGLIKQTNPAFHKLFGYAGDEVFGLSLTAIAASTSAAALAEALTSVVASDQPARIELVAWRKDGSLLDAEMALAPIGVEEGSDIVCNLRDITQRKQVEQELRRTLDQERELNELKSRFVSTVSHEFRTPLAVILSSAHLVKAYGDRLTEEQKLEQFGKIERSVGYMAALLEDVLTIGQADADEIRFKPAPLDLEACCQSIIDDVWFTGGETHRIAFASAGVCAEAFMDEQLLRQIFANLLSNAVKYSPPSSTVYFDVNCQGEQIVFRVRDEGIGIPAEDQKHICEAFFRAKNVSNIKGTGLGLTIAKRAVELHGGTMAFESAVGVGTTFIVTLPVGRLESAK